MALENCVIEDLDKAKFHLEEAARNLGDDSFWAIVDNVDAVESDGNDDDVAFSECRGHVSVWDDEEIEKYYPYFRCLEHFEKYDDPLKAIRTALRLKKGGEVVYPNS